MKEVKILLNSIQETHELSDLAGRAGFTVSAVDGGAEINVASILGAMSLDLKNPITLQYEGANAALEAFIAARKVG